MTIGNQLPKIKEAVIVSPIVKNQLSLKSLREPVKAGNGKPYCVRLAFTIIKRKPVLKMVAKKTAFVTKTISLDWVSKPTLSMIVMITILSTVLMIIITYLIMLSRTYNSFFSLVYFSQMGAWTSSVPFLMV